MTNTPEWIEAIKQRREAATCGSLHHYHQDVGALLQLVEKQREALETCRQSVKVSPEGYTISADVLLKAHEKATEAMNFQPEGLEA